MNTQQYSIREQVRRNGKIYYQLYTSNKFVRHIGNAEKLVQFKATLERERQLGEALTENPGITSETKSIETVLNRANTPPMPSGLFNVIYADPPWQYDNTGVNGAAEHHYETMPTEDICRLRKILPIFKCSDAPLNSRGTRRGMNPNSRRNLNKGHLIRDKHAAKKEFSITACAREKLLEPCPHDPSMTWREYLAYQWLENAVDNSTFFKELTERLEGRTVQPISMPEGLEVRQKVEVISASDIQPALAALVSCGAVAIYSN